MSVIRVGAVDNHPVVLEGIRAVLGRIAPDLSLDLIAGSVDELLDGPPTEVVLLDVVMPDQPSVEERVRRLVAAGRVVLLFTGEERPIPIRRAIAAGASGLVLKVDPLESLAESIRAAMAGELACSGSLAAMLLTDPSIGTHLTPRQVEILQAVSTGLPYRLVAKQLGVKEATVREHLTRATEAYRGEGVEVGNVHGLLSRARADGHLTGGEGEPG